MVLGFLVRRRKHDALLGAQVVLASAGGFGEVLPIVCQGTVGDDQGTRVDHCGV